MLAQILVVLPLIPAVQKYDGCTKKIWNSLLRRCTFQVRITCIQEYTWGWYILNHDLEDVSMDTLVGNPIVKKCGVATLESH